MLEDIVAIPFVRLSVLQRYFVSGIGLGTSRLINDRLLIFAAKA